MLQIPRVIPVALLALALSVIGGCSSTRAPIGSDSDGGSKPDSGGGSVVPGACGKLVCAATATCEGKGASAKCVCGDGYRDAKGNGTKCDDIDECVASTDACDSHAVCANTKGSYTCTCDAPVYVGDGKKCGCAAGYDAVGDKCIVSAPTKCTKDSGCDTGHCVSGVCCATACDEPGSCQLADDATCDDGANCVYAAKPEGTVCEDGEPCTTGDVCTDGECKAVGTDSCDDSNVCTDDTCEAGFGCVSDGRSVATTTACGDDDLCGKTYLCKGDVVGTCEATVDRVDCSVGDTDCKKIVCDPTDGSCDPVSINEAGDCEDGNACTVGETCTVGVCGGSVTRDCSDGNGCTTDACDAALGCSYPANTAACDDSNPCTVSDVCGSGTCQSGAPKNCAATSDPCNVGTCDPSDGVCKKVPVNNGTSCNDGNSCSAVDTCQNGTCTGSGTSDACGSINVTGCTASTPNVCTCNNTYVNYLGQCVPNVNECAGGCGTAACNANSTCADPSATCGNRVCTCTAGFTDSDATGQANCVNVNECVGNPCGAGFGTCAENTPGAGYACSCNVGYKSIDGSNDGVANPTCECDMGGTFAIRIQSDVSWSGIANVEDSMGSVVTYSWAIRQQTYGADGTLNVTSTACGGTSPELCGSGVSSPAIPPEAYGLFLSNQIWATSGMPVQTSLPLSLANARPGDAFVTPQEAVVLGISLTNPLLLVDGWPAANQDVGPSAGSPGPTNGAYWVNSDSAVDPDNKPGVTIYAVPPGGFAIDTIHPDPPVAFPATSATCPRGSITKGLPYNYTPAPELTSIIPPIITARRIKRFFAASRVISAMNGSITSCDLMSGEVTGPVADSPVDTDTFGEYQSDARFYDCVRVAGASETDCSDAVTDFFDNTAQTQKVDDAKFIIKRVAPGTTCGQVRAMAFP